MLRLTPMLTVPETSARTGSGAQDEDRKASPGQAAFFCSIEAGVLALIAIRRGFIASGAIRQ
jgi:hypothetical protein